MNAVTVRRLGWVAAVAAGSAAALWAVRGALPEEVATHWGPSGRPDGSMRLATFLVVHTVLVLVTGAMLLPSGRAYRPAAAFALTMLVLVDLALVAANWGADDWREARSLPFPVVLLFVGAAAGVAALVRRRLPRETPPPPPPATIGPGERVVWTGGARNTALLAVAAVAFALLTASLVAGVPLRASMLVPLLATVAVAGTAQASVVVSEAGVRVAFGPWGWPRLTVPTTEIVAAEAGRHRAPSWGYRGSRRIFGRAVVAVRRGPTLELSLADGSTLAVTVDDAETAAEVVRGFVGRAAEAAAP